MNEQMKNKKNETSCASASKPSAIPRIDKPNEKTINGIKRMEEKKRWYCGR